MTKANMCLVVLMFVAALAHGEAAGLVPPQSSDWGFGAAVEDKPLKMVRRIKIGMTKDQVHAILGAPEFADGLDTGTRSCIMNEFYLESGLWVRYNLWKDTVKAVRILPIDP